MFCNFCTGCGGDKGAGRGNIKGLDAIAAGAAEETPALAALFEEPFVSEDFQEGYRAFLEKRAAKVAKS